ncbi:nucleotide sugar dehydrogenase family protein [Synechococcus sp. Minos11]|uniref:nucleotide sugar dehydrogenase n=1 Tax=Synechococcus sp. Minos11 TaxID=221341 RepID=UPI0016486692|nr:nucleotide sugar dehydrogenase [Synechococcus sp. Minos11]QNJ07690.1 nucleotide sugar dehydrogenase family protein [Synechococcus sp. Minos11]
MLASTFPTKYLLVNPGDTISSVIQKMGRSASQFIEMCFIIDNSSFLLGVLNHADIIRALADGVDLKEQVSTIMITDFISASYGLPEEDIIIDVRLKLFKKSGGSKELTRFVPLLDDGDKLCDVIDIFSLLSNNPTQGCHIDIYGLGFVGLTLGVTLASRGHYITGIDTNLNLISQLSAGQPHVFEPRLKDMLINTLETGHFKVQVSTPDHHSKVVIITVGTPVDSESVPSLDALFSVCNAVGPKLKQGDLVMLRSTVPVGTTRSQVIPLLESLSHLRAGKDFHVAFTPERTVEGQAMSELTSLPQIVGGFSSQCASKASAFWQTLSNTVLVESLEAAELVKLINNSYRDLSFSFANGFALLADQFNLDAFKVIAAANEGYPRNPIPQPSPGVGGYCLTKDPFLYSSIDNSAPHSLLSQCGRHVNKLASDYPLLVLNRFLTSLGLQYDSLSVLVAGLAFKGLPETNDLRGSIGIDLCEQLLALGVKVSVFDAVVSQSQLPSHFPKLVKYDGSLLDIDALLILNNHPDNVPDNLLTLLQSSKTKLIFDGWSMLDRIDVENVPNLIYSSMGYCSSINSSC